MVRCIFFTIKPDVLCLQVELSKEEFAEAMAIKPNSLFVEHFFSLIDSDRNGYISFREFLNAVVLFSKGQH